jgi:hypothetical protein
LTKENDLFLFYPISNFLSSKRFISNNSLFFEEKASTSEVSFSLHRHTLFFNVVEPINIHNLYKDERFYFSIHFNIKSGKGRRPYLNPFEFLKFAKDLLFSVQFFEGEVPLFINSKVEEFIHKTERKIFLLILGIA